QRAVHRDGVPVPLVHVPAGDDQAGVLRPQAHRVVRVALEVDRQGPRVQGGQREQLAQDLEDGGLRAEGEVLDGPAEGQAQGTQLLRGHPAGSTGSGGGGGGATGSTSTVTILLRRPAAASAVSRSERPSGSPTTDDASAIGTRPSALASRPPTVSTSSSSYSSRSYSSPRSVMSRRALTR